MALISACCLLFSVSNGLRPAPSFLCRSVRSRNRPLFSSIGGGSTPPNNNDKKKGGKGDFEEFFDPNYQESENLQRAREYMSENSLPINFDLPLNEDDTAQDSSSSSSDLENSSAIVMKERNGRMSGSSPGEMILSGNFTEESLARNPYMAVVSRLSPSELISKFTATAHPRVQNAVRQTILGMIGGLPKLAFDTTTITTGQRLASLMFQLQMTGYMFKNADYRLSLQQSLSGSYSTSQSSQLLLSGSDDDEDDETRMKASVNGKVHGKLKIRYASKNEDGKDDNNKASSSAANGVELEVDAAAYMSELRLEVSQLRDELMTARKAKEEALRKDLLLYIRTLPEKELRSLTNTMSPDVLVAMKGLVNAVISGIGDGQIGPNTVTEQSGEAMAQLCMWQLAIGYNLRTLEVREEMKLSLASAASVGMNGDDFEGGIDYSGEPGVLE